MSKTNIEWTDYTWNPITGCKQGCSYCYARKMAENPFYAKAFPYKFEPHFYPERKTDLAKIPDGSKVFVCSMGELFADGHEDWTRWVINRIKEFHNLTFQVLTKQPQNLIKYSPFPDNCWVGVSVTGNRDIGRMGYLRNVKARVKFVSFEPLLANIDGWWIDGGLWNALLEFGISWLIIGQQTPVRKATMPKLEWVKEIVEAADKASAPVFLKNNLTHIFVRDSSTQDISFQEHFKWVLDFGGEDLRQEFPKMSLGNSLQEVKGVRR